MSDTFNTELEIKLANLFKARFPYVYIPTWEEKRVCDFVCKIANDASIIKYVRNVFIWSLSEGLVNRQNNNKISGTTDPIKAMDFIITYNGDAIFIFLDLHIFLGVQGRPVSYELIRKMRDIIPDMHEGDCRKNAVLISPQLVIPADMQKEISIFDFPLPNVSDLKALLNRIIYENELNPDLSDEEMEMLAKSALGLTAQEAENAFSRAIVQNRGLDKNAKKIIFDEKNQVIKKTGMLEFVSSNLNLDDVGGLENLKNWLNKRNNSWLDSARRYNIPAPKGVLITGIPGCGKSLTAKATSEIWQLPLLKLDMGKIFSGIVGSSEENMRRAISTAEAVAPSILWVDEIEKGLGGLGGGNSDSGTSTRVFGTFLTWLQEKTAPVFVIATANNISSLPPELLRKGRFDEIFFVDLPTKSERMKIFEVHLNKYVKKSEVGNNIDVSSDFLEKLSDLSEGFVGAEIEQAVVAALYEAFFHQRDVVPSDFENAIKSTVPLSVTQKEQIMKLRQWADLRAVSATKIDDLKSYKSNSSEQDINAHRGGRILDY